MTLKSRTKKINKVSKTASLVYDNLAGRKIYAVRSTRTDKPYQVTVEWLFKNVILTARVKLYSFENKEQVNKLGNIRVDFCRSTVGYKALGALRFAARKAGKVLSFCKSRANALRLLRFGGELIRIENLGGGVVWGTVR